MRKSSDETLVAAMYILAQDIQTQDGIANAAVREAGDRIAELRQQRDELLSAMKDVVSAWTEQFERNGHAAPAWAIRARKAIVKINGE